MEMLEQLGRIYCWHRGVDPDSVNYDGKMRWRVHSEKFHILAEALEGYVIIPVSIHEALKKECGL